MSNINAAAHAPINPTSYTLTLERKIPPFTPSQHDGPPANHGTLSVNDVPLLNLKYLAEVEEDGSFSTAEMFVNKELMLSLFGIPVESWSDNPGTLFSQLAYALDYLPGEAGGVHPSKWISYVNNPQPISSYILENLSGMRARGG